MVGDEEGKGRHGMGGREGRGGGGARANALLMVFIQAWKLQARPPHWQLGVNLPLLNPPITHLWLLPLWRGGELSSSAAASVPRPWYLKCNTRETFCFQLPNFEQTLSVISVEAPQKPATVCKFQMTNRKCGAVQASLTGTTVTGKGANWVFFYLWLLFWRLLVDSSFKFQLIAAVNHDLCEEWAEASILHNRSGYKSNKAFEARGNIRILHKAMQLLNWLNNLSMLCICLCPAMEDQMQHGVSDLLETGSFWIYPPLIYNKGVGSQHSSDGSRQLTSPS